MWQVAGYIGPIVWELKDSMGIASMGIKVLALTDLLHLEWSMEV